MAIKSTSNDSSDFRSLAWRRLAPSWKMTSDLWMTALDIRAKGDEYLTKFKNEPADKYERRKNRSVIINEFRETIEKMAGMVFRTDPRPADVDPSIDTMMTDIDMAGNSFWAFNIDKFALFLRDGNGFIYVDATLMSDDAAKKLQDGKKLTLLDRRDDRVFWVFYEASQVINYRYEKRGSRQVLSQVTIAENVTRPVGAFGEEQSVQHLVLRPGSWERWGQNPKTHEFDVLLESGLTGLDFIPGLPIDDFDATPMFLTLGMLNILHYNQTSDYDNICQLVCVPEKIQKYATQQDATASAKMKTAAPGIGQKIWGEHADIFYVEVEGKGLDHVRQRYQDIETQMAKIGVGMLQPAEFAGIRTAAEVLDNAGQRQSKLAVLARRWQNAIEKALYITAQYINAIKGPNTINLADEEASATMAIKIDYERLTFSIEQLQFFADMVDSGKMSLKTFLDWLPQVFDMPPGFSAEGELKNIKDGNSIIVDPEPIK